MFVINSLAGGGAERVMSTLLHHSATERDEFDISLILLDEEAPAYTPPHWLTVHNLGCQGSLLASVRALRSFFDQTQPDVSLSFLTRANIANIWATRGRGCVISERVNTSSHFEAGLRGRIARLVVRMAYPRASRVVAVSPGVAEDLHAHFKVPQDKLVTIENPVEIEAVGSRARERPELVITGPYVVGMGRLVPNKNFALLIEAFQRSGHPGKLVILGDGPERPHLKGLAESLGLGDRVLLPGFLANPFPTIAGAEVFVLPSNAEGFPNGLIEAMALGVAVISTNCASGPSEILAHRPRCEVSGLMQAEFGVLIPPGGAELLADALRLMQQPDVRRRYAERAAVRAADFRVEVAKDRYWSILRAEAARS